MQYLSLQFSNVDDFEAANAKFPLDMALAFPNANALIHIRSYCSTTVKNFTIESSGNALVLCFDAKI